MNNLYKKLNLDLDFNDWRFLVYLTQKYVYHGNPYLDGRSPVPVYFKSVPLFKSENDYRSNPLFEKIRQLFTDESAYSNLEHLYQNCIVANVPDTLPPHYGLVPCGINIPLTPITTPINWYDSDMNVIGEYYYDHPATLINTKLMHGAPSNSNIRLFLIIGGWTEDFETTLTKFKPSALID